MEKVPVVRDILQAYEEGKATRDPRTKDLFMLSNNPVYVWIITIVYILTVTVIGPRFMKNRPAYSFPRFLVVYNSVLVVWSTYMFVEIIASAIHADYWKNGFLCCVYNQDTPKNPKEERMAKVLHMFFISKLVELVDSILMVLRKKQEQISFLHVYHHSSIVNIYWWVTTYIPGGQSWFCSSLNAFVHIIMYAYYALAAIPSMRGRLWWKKYITRLQLIQFVLIFFHTIQTTFTGCDFPLWSHILLSSYMISMMVLFGNFYVQAYIKKSRASHKKTDQIQNGGAKNDSLHHGNGVNGHSNGIVSDHKKVK
ncbi:elongation of very long chain fatty acids protein 2-like isoform X2 [Ostrea edulis]|nr:elongation of very long chain fatty acids protein 2-like isoform X2 [Ostrea edulis]XP_048759081.2 elongation of very long chain fatty acids protein 2-like isoform X2 [Ostrea edulis]XP_056018060.1 elongation of very long chain fatty acids protein 2-like isoform X2 [Ostrea edulis]